jgi:hypothetical protein
MAESSTSLTRTEIKRALGKKLGWSGTVANWASDADFLADANEIIESGERTFYGAHDWSFAKIIMRLPIVSGKADYDLPDDFHYFSDTHLTFDRGDNKYCHVRLTGVGEVLKARQSPITVSVQPEMAAETWLPADGAKPQRKGLMLWPEPTDAGTLSGEYRFNPHGITDTVTYPLGGNSAGQALYAAIMAAAELHRQEEDRTWRDEYAVQLALAIKMDNDAACPKYFGRMRGSARGGSSMRPSNHYVTYAGNLYLGAD